MTDWLKMTMTIHDRNFSPIAGDRSPTYNPTYNSLLQASFFNIFTKLSAKKTRKNSKLSQFFNKTKLIFFPKLKFPAIFIFWPLKLVKKVLNFVIFIKIQQNLSKNMKNSSSKISKLKFKITKLNFLAILFAPSTA